MNLKEDQSIVIQGITGREASFWAQKMKEYGTNIIGGTSPGKEGEEVSGIPVFNTIRKITSQYQVDSSILFIPPLLVKRAALEAIEEGIKQLLILADGVPVHDTMAILSLARLHKVSVLGPNTPGIVFPERSSLGIMPCWLRHVFRRGVVSILSRSGSLGNEICYQVSQSGYGVSSFIGIGGDALVGTTFYDVLMELKEDSQTKAVILVGELGGNMEEKAAEYLKEIGIPVLTYIAGKTAPVGVPMGHAGAIMEGSTGSAQSKIEILEKKGAFIIHTPKEIGNLLSTVIKGEKGN